MSKKNKNPYNIKCAYGKLFAYWKSKQVITRSELMAEAKRLGLSDTASTASVTVLLSPSKSNDTCRGDCRGNYSARGHIYYAERLNQKANEEKRYRLRYRPNPMKPRIRPIKEEVKSVKVSKVVETVDTPIETSVTETV